MAGFQLDPRAGERAPGAAPSGFHYAEPDDREETERSENKKAGQVRQSLTNLRTERAENSPDHEAEVEIQEGGQERWPMAGAC